MPVFRRDDADLYFEEGGDGFPVLLLAPGGMRSNLANWQVETDGPFLKYVDWTKVLADRYKLIAMDQRNAGRSTSEIASDHGWHTYAADQLALMEHLGLARFHAIGGSIGCSFILNLCRIAPTRVVSAVLQNPLGFTSENPNHYSDAFSAWAEELMNGRPEIEPEAVARLRANMWGGGFVFSVGRDSVSRVTVPTLVMPGNDIPHPEETSGELIDLLPNADSLADWNSPEFTEIQRDSVIAFLERHTP